jgi:hypothetical protein
MQCLAQSLFHSPGPTRHSALSLALLACLYVLLVDTLLVAPAAAAAAPVDISIQGSGIQPQLGFACCDQGIAQMQELFADPATIAALRNLHAQVAVAIVDFSPERAKVVRMLNQQQIPVIAWMMLPAEQGQYFNADNAAEAPARINAFEKWTADNSLHWAAIGLDIEPDFAGLAALKAHRWQLITTLLHRAIDGQRMRSAQQAYSALIRELQSKGYAVQTYAMPYLPAERSVNSTLPDRLLGTVDVRGDDEYLMLYTSYARMVGPAMIWSLGPHAQSIAVGVTDGAQPAGVGSGPLDWDEFSRSLLVASHYANRIGVYNLEGCVRQGFLPRLKEMNWSESVSIPAAQVSHARRLGAVLRVVLWTVSHLLYLIAVVLALIVWLIWRRCVRRHRLMLSD